ncbi:MULTISPECIES: LysR family transcriptional regulator [Lonsdalea]|uniref:Transcriptional regulator n=2 Tax=Lonsdalea TaxID=1082702 RepID=A0ACD1JEE3_9GAMM|nr:MULTISPECIES: LysR family transcriptional regulator [Lonsdalea]OSM94192.1 transcriptional regulator [Lonsdalea populi]OSN00926.1 transcriptional regulator [Lonsdalea populi]QPQ23496.1 LysR family transcriptional regulator [Lonsdalea populi]RAT14822.1 transcriptional regulator [Lonsdalea quercina]RAT14905.1 transcriptional regulator [Lonsdalea quercina]
MNSNSLRLFKAVAESGSVKEASKRLHCVSSNVTTRLKRLEARLNVCLFRRERNRLYITPEGEYLLGYANKILALIDEAERNLQAQNPSGPLRLGSMETTAAIRLPSLLSSFSRNTPLVELSLETHPTRQLVEAVLNGKLDIAFVADYEHLPRGLLGNVPVWRETLVLVTRKDHPGVLTVADLQIKKPLALGVGCNYRYRFEQWLSLQGVVGPGPQEFGSFQAILGCVASGMGISLLPESVVSQYTQSFDIRCHAIDPAIGEVDTLMIWLKSRESGRGVTAFRQFVIKHSSAHDK